MFTFHYFLKIVSKWIFKKDKCTSALIYRGIIGIIYLPVNNQKLYKERYEIPVLWWWIEVVQDCDSWGRDKWSRLWSPRLLPRRYILDHGAGSRWGVWVWHSGLTDWRDRDWRSGRLKSCEEEFHQETVMQKKELRNVKSFLNTKNNTKKQWWKPF